MQHLIARYGEISLKGKNRSQFERALERNMHRVLQGIDATLVHSGGRLVVSVADGKVEEAVERLKNVFGVVSLSPVRLAELTVESIEDAVVDLLGQEFVRLPNATFKIEVRRANKRFPLQSPELAKVLGGSALLRIPALKVDVHTPDITVYVEVRDREALVFGSKVPAVGGMPVGTAGRIGLLLSGGIDSPVAGWLSLKRGVELEAIYFHSPPYTSDRALQKVEDLARVLARWGGRVRLHVVHFTDVQVAIRKDCPDALGITIMRRMMLRIAEAVAHKRNWLALATGESLGQVASQTLESMRVINAVTNMPVLRPLIAEDKVDIIRRARQIGTYDISILPYEDCCTLFVSSRPRTRPRFEETEFAESKLDVPTLVAEAVARTTMNTYEADVPVGTMANGAL